jgi:hypothetical protein
LSDAGQKWPIDATPGLHLPCREPVRLLDLGFFHSQPQAEGNWFTDQRSSVICEETWLNHSILCVPLPTYVRAKNKKPRMEAKQGDVLDVLSSGIAKSAANEPKFEPQHLAKEVPAEPRRQLLTEKMLADRWVCSVARLQLVDVNYPDRSATTILAGGSGE